MEYGEVIQPEEITKSILNNQKNKILNQRRNAKIDTSK